METILRTITPEKYSEIITEAGRALASGEIVAMPTETVYGLGAHRDNSAALERLIRLKNRPKDKPFTLHLADRSDLLKYTPGTNRFARRLTDRYWPGPLTIIVDSLSGEKIGLRVPGHLVTRDIIRAAGVPVILPSANPAGVQPACTAEKVMEFYDGEIDLVVDDGKTNIGDPSTVVSITDDGFSVTRTGIISLEDLITTACLKILFICTGNTCRSPMAEGILRKILADRKGCAVEDLPFMGYRIESAGISTGIGERAALNAIKSLGKWKIDLTGHKTQPVVATKVREADRIFVMTSAQQARLWGMEEGLQSKVELLDRKDRDILDPFGGSESVYARCASQIYTNLLEIVETL